MWEVTRIKRNPWSIFDELEALQADLNRAMSGESGAGSEAPRVRRRPYPLLNVLSSEQGVVVDAELPGVPAKEIDVSVEGNELTLSGQRPEPETVEGMTYHRRERSMGSFSRTLQLPFRADPNGVKASYRNGVLRVTVPRSAEEQRKRITIEA